MSKKLFDDSDESDGGLQVSTNKDYAKSYNNFRKKELLKKFKDRGYDDVDSESSSESDSTDDDAVVDVKFDQEFFKTLASLKSKDPVIYDKSTRFFGEVADENETEDTVENSSNKEKKAKPISLKDYERRIMLERGGKFEEDSDDEEPEEYNRLRAESPTVVEEERRLKAEFKKVMNAEEESEEEEFGGIFKKRQKSKEEAAKEEEDFVEWLAGKQNDIEENVKEKLEPLKNYWSSSKLPQSERFLRDYILNKGYATTNHADIPTYDEIVGDTAHLSEDEQELEKQAEFEHKYNFRFEEPDAEFIKRYPRTVETSVRHNDDKRKQKRQDVKQRKQEEKEQKMKEFEIIKEMKRKEIEDKISKLKRVTGNEELGFKDEELEEEFDPDAHDRRMQEIFNDEYYQVDEGEEKPECPSDVEELKTEDWDNYDPQNEYAGDDYNTPHCEDEDFNMDCDYDPASAKEQLQNELIENTKGRKSRRGRRNRFMEMIQAEKPAFDPVDEKTYADYIEEYYQMDCEDIIGDLPCRFKYVETTPNDFGLSIEEILLAKNKELNQWASLKKAIQIRPHGVEKKEQRLYRMKAQNEDLKKKIFKSLYGDGSDEEEEVAENTNQVTEAIQNVTERDESAAPIVKTEESKSKKKRRKRKAQKEMAELAQSNASADTSLTTQNGAESAPAKKPKLEQTNIEAQLKIEQNETRKAEDVVNKKQTKKKKKANKQTQNQVASFNVGTNKFNKKQNRNDGVNSSKQQSPSKRSVTPLENRQNNNPFTTVIAKEQQPGAVTPLKNNKNNPFSKAKGPSDSLNHKSSLPPLRNQGVANDKSKRKGQKPSFNASKPKFNKFGNSKFTKAKSNGIATPGTTVSDERLKAYGINPRKFHKKQMYGKKN